MNTSAPLPILRRAMKSCGASRRPIRPRNRLPPALALQLAIEQAGSLEMDDVRQALFDLDEVTFYGPINFDETGKNAAKPMGAIQIQDGVINVIAPSEAAVADVMPMVPWDER